MIKTYFVDGDKGGVGKSTVARAVVDMLIQSERFGLPNIDKIVIVDADPMSDDVCGEGGYVTEMVGDTQIVAVRFPISVIEHWVEIIDRLSAIEVGGDIVTENVRIVFSLPAGAGLILMENPFIFDMMELFNGVPVWVLGNEESSVKQLKMRIDIVPAKYEKGFAVRNLKHGTAQSFSHWNNSAIKNIVLDWGWQEIDFPVGMSSVMADLGRTPAHRAASTSMGVNGKKLGAGTMLVLNSYRDVTCTRLSVLERGSEGDE